MRESFFLQLSQKSQQHKIMNLKRSLDHIFVAVSALFLFILIVFRDIGLPDDFEYLKMFDEINSDFHGASEKYGFIFKIYIILVDSIFRSGVLMAFALVPVLLAVFVIALGRSNPSWVFSAIIMSMPVVWFVQLRQALALVFVLGFVLARQRLLKYFFSFLACLSHLSVMPFAVWYLLVADSKFVLLKSKFLNAIASVVSVLFMFVFIKNIDFISFYTGFPFNVLISDEALNEGRLGVGLVIIFYFHVIYIKAYKLLSEEVIFSILSIGAAIILVAILMPLLQRLLLPFALYLLTVFYSSTRVNFLHRFLGVSVLGSFFTYKIYELLMS